MFRKIEVMKDCRKVALDFDVNIPEKLVFYGKYPALGEGFLCIKMGKTQYIAKLEMGNNHPIFKNVGEPTNHHQAIDNFYKLNPYNIRMLENVSEVPIIEMTSYNSMQLIHLVSIETGTTPARYRMPAGIRAELLDNKIPLPDLTNGLSDDSNTISNVWINIDIDKNGHFQTGFDVEQYSENEQYSEDEQDTNSYSY